MWSFVPLLHLLAALVSCFSLAKANGTTSQLSFGLINGGSGFFDAVREGWELRCRELGVDCTHEIGEDEPGAACTHREDLVRQWIAEGVNGIALTPCKDEHDFSLGGGTMINLFEEARQQGVPIVTFDSDVPNSTRVAYVGTDNRFLGRTMARLLRQLRPKGGTFGFVGVKPEREEGFIEEITKFNDRNDRAHWHQVVGDFDRYEIDWNNQMEHYALRNVTAMIAMIQSPMRDSNWTGFVEHNRHRDITYIGTDGSDYQLDYLQRRFVDGLVGQLPYEMGTKSLQVLYDNVTKGSLPQSIFPTNLVSYNLIPLELPPPDVDQHLIGNLKYVGFIFYGIVVVAALACVGWTCYYRRDIVVKAAQPPFLVMVAGGVLIMSSSLIPLSFDDNGDPESMTESRSKGICMSIPWLLFTGFTVTFSALLSKTWRVNRLFHAKIRHARIEVCVKDVILPFVALLTGNIIVLICWTVLDPLMYLRVVDIGTDSWNREIFSYGGCRCNTAVAYLVPLAAINLGAIGFACWQAYQARDIKSEFSEAKYIGLTVFSLFQAFLMGIPIVAVVRNMPEAYYLVLVIMIFVLCMAILLLIFLPKMRMQRRYAGMSPAERKRAMQKSLRKSSETSGTGSSHARRNSSGRQSSAGNFAMNSVPEQDMNARASQRRVSLTKSTRALARQMNVSVDSSSNSESTTKALAQQMNLSLESSKSDSATRQENSTPELPESLPEEDPADNGVTASDDDAVTK